MSKNYEKKKTIKESMNIKNIVKNEFFLQTGKNKGRSDSNRNSVEPLNIPSNNLGQLITLGSHSKSDNIPGSLKKQGPSNEM